MIIETDEKEFADFLVVEKVLLRKPLTQYTIKLSVYKIKRRVDVWGLFTFWYTLDRGVIDSIILAKAEIADYMREKGLDEKMGYPIVYFEKASRGGW